MTRLAIIFSLLFVTPAWAENVDGNSFLCSPIESSRTKDVKAVEFKRSKASVYKGERRIVREKYYANAGLVNWGGWADFNMYSMNRKTLRLKLEFNVSSPLHGQIMGEWDCEPMEIKKAIGLAEIAGKERDKKLREGNKF